MIYGNKFLNHNIPSEAKIIYTEMTYAYELDDIFTEEYTGKENLNEEFKQCIKDFDTIINIFIDRIKMVMKIFDKMVDLLLSINKKNLFKVNNDIRNLGRDGNKEIEKNYNSINKQYAQARRHFDNIASKFAVKYSSVTMDMKEEYSKKLEKYSDFLYGVFEKYATDEFITRVNSNKDNAINACELNGKDCNYYYDIIGVIQSWYDFLCNEVSYTLGDIRHIYIKFGSKDNPIFKLLNKDYEEKLTKMKTLKLV
jgi:hypothetical protein